MAMALGLILLRARTTFVRVAAGALLGPTSFFLVSNYATWASGFAYPYPRTLGGLGACFAAGCAVLSQRPALDGGRLPGWRLGFRCWCGG